MEFEFTISELHPSLAGHFPGNPIVPGVIILDEILRGIIKFHKDLKVTGFSAVKFIGPIKPEQKVCVVITKNNNLINFECYYESKKIANGSVKLVGL